MTKAPKHATRIYNFSFDIALGLVSSPVMEGKILLRNCQCLENSKFAVMKDIMQN